LTIQQAVELKKLDIDKVMKELENAIGNKEEV
jgi:hypothetical protein